MSFKLKFSDPDNPGAGEEKSEQQFILLQVRLFTQLLQHSSPAEPGQKGPAMLNIYTTSADKVSRGQRLIEE